MAPKLLNEDQIERLEVDLQRYVNYQKQLTVMIQKNQLTDYRNLSQKKAQLEKKMRIYQKYKTIQQQVNDLRLTMRQTPGLSELAQTEITTLEGELNALVAKINQLSAVRAGTDTKVKSVIIEINGAVGGEEANIFAADLFRMYSRYAERQKWKLRIIDSHFTEAGGISSLTFKVSGQHVADKLQFEGGAHRVQRVPKTEHKGRVHTSVATVAVLPEVNPIVVNLQSKDLRIDTYRASSAGGQHVNVTDSAVRITHLPTGIVATSQDGRSQHDNRSLAMEHLRAKVFNFFKSQQQAKTNQLRKQATGTGRRNEKIRTYNFPQNRLSDHRLNRSWNKLAAMIDGDLDDLLTALHTKLTTTN